MTTKAKRVLIVDPHPDVLITIQKVLEDAGFDTETAWSGVETILLLDSEHFDVVLINEYLPDSTCEGVQRAMAVRECPAAVVVMQPASVRMNQDNPFTRMGVSAVVCKHDLASVQAAVTKAAESHESWRPDEKLHLAG